MYVISSHPKGGDNVNVIRSLCHENAFSLTAMLMINGLGTECGSGDYSMYLIIIVHGE